MPPYRGPGLDGIIPARAGSRPRRPSATWRPRDHPRACGEQYNVLLTNDSHTGSSPRVRGAGVERLLQCARARIIPARAGSRARHDPDDHMYGDHPRACGEQYASSSSPLISCGSSPRVRGAAVLPAPLHHDAGIIPARAGSSDLYAPPHVAL